MWMICKKEWQQFFGGITGYIAITVFLTLNGLYLFVLPDTNILDFGYATLDSFFSIAPWIMMFLVPVITMRSLSDEYKGGTFEILKTLPLTDRDILIGKFLAAFFIVVVSLLPTLVYPLSIQRLSSLGGIDVGATFGSYIGLFLLGAVYVSIGIFASSYTDNTIIALLVATCTILLLLAGVGSLSKLPLWGNEIAYYVEMLGIGFHFKNIGKGVIDLKDIVYFSGLCLLFLYLTFLQLQKKATIRN